MSTLTRRDDDEERADWRELAERGSRDHLRECEESDPATVAVGRALGVVLAADEVELAAILAIVRECHAAGLSPVLVRAVFSAFEQIHPKLASYLEPEPN